MYGVAFRVLVCLGCVGGGGRYRLRAIFFRNKFGSFRIMVF